MICCSSCAWLLLVKEEEKWLKSEEELHKTEQDGCPNPEFITVIPLLPLLPPPRRFWSILTIFDQVVWPSRLVLGKKFFWIWFIYALEGIVLASQFFFLTKCHIWNTLAYMLLSITKSLLHQSPIFGFRRRSPPIQHIWPFPWQGKSIIHASRYLNCLKRVSSQNLVVI